MGQKALLGYAQKQGHDTGALSTPLHKSMDTEWARMTCMKQ